MSENFIPGIYNYCDRWCERCTFTSRCRNYEKTGDLSPDQLDMSNKAFWETISTSFQEAFVLLQEAAEKHGYDFNKPLTEEEETAYNENEEMVEAAIDKHPIPALCEQYRKIVLPFANTSEEMVGKAKELVAHANLGITSEEEVVHTMAGIGDCMEIIQWYVFFLDAKLQRALRGKIEGEEWDVENGYPKDSDGSAKIAVISIDKSMAAWSRLYQLMPTAEDTAITALSLLSKLKQRTLDEFPECMSFKRAGFDD